MSKSLFVLICTLVLTLEIHASERMHVKVVQRQVNDHGYSNFVPGHSYTTDTGNVNCNSYGTSTNCNETASGTTTYTAPHAVGYSVTGATFTLQLPDGKLAVVNCVSKYKPKGDYINRRSCRMPIIDDIDAEFKGKNAKLYWPVSIDGKKMESETYEILGIIPASPQPPPSD